MDTVLVFSRDRPLQLACTLATLRAEAVDLAEVQVQVLLCATDEVYLRQYREVCAEQNGCGRILFIEERNFADDLRASLQVPEVSTGFVSNACWPGTQDMQSVARTTERFERVLFVVDDCIFVRRFQFAACRRLLDERHDVLGCSLRLGSNCTVNYMAGSSQDVPALTDATDGLVTFDWTAADGDFGYPLEVSSSIYRVADILPALDAAPRNPNLLEWQLMQLCEGFRGTRPRLACHTASVAFCNPINLVQTVSDNKAGTQADHDVEALSRRFARGERICHTAFHAFVPTGCHQEVPLQFEVPAERDREPPRWTTGLVSVVIPTYNRRDTVLASIESVLAQTYEQLEVLVIDDGSTDGTGASIRDRYGTDPRVRYVWQENAERCAARNAGIGLARGEFVAFLDSDDLWLPEKLAKQLQVFAADPRVDLVHADFAPYDAEGNATFSEPRPAEHGKQVGDVFDYLLTSDPIGTLTVVVRRAALEERGSFRNDPHLIPFEDWELWARISYRSRVGYVPEQVALYRVHDGNTGVPVEPENYLVFWRMVQAYLRTDDVAAASAASHRGYWSALLHGRRFGFALLGALPKAVRFMGVGPLLRNLVRSRRRFVARLFGRSTRTASRTT